MEVSAALAISPSSDERLWSRLRDRVDSILDNRGPKIDLPPSSSVWNSTFSILFMMATKASYLSRELKTIKSELSFMQERCNLLEEENRRFQEDFDKGVRPEEDDLVRLQLEVLLAEKSRLANENANLMRENQCLHQLVEYHHLTSQDLSASYEQAAIHGMCLDFSSPIPKSDIDDENGHSDCEVPLTPSTGKLGLFSSLDEHLEIHHDM
ncbi:hypothetical protein GW17_00030513 [Ensete ventricosum]|nr:hypothetical protein GW17_00030513 [Ensete ventricosum]